MNKEEDCIYSVYLITNLVNGKIYIGKTKKSLEKRFEDHLNDGKDLSNTRFLMNAIRKYGQENFKIELIETTPTEQDSYNRESYWIMEKRSHERNIGYNMIIGGGEAKGTYDPIESIKKNKKVLSIRLTNYVKKSGIGVNKEKNKYAVVRNHLGKVHRYTTDNLDLAKEISDKFSIYVYGKDIPLNFPEKANNYTQIDLEENFKLFSTRKRPKTSSFKGVGKLGNKWTASINFHGFRRFLGYFDTEKEAAIAVDKARYFLKGENSIFYNFKENLEDYKNIDLNTWFNNNSYKEYPNISFSKPKQKFQVTHKEQKIGQFQTLEQAIEAWDMAILYYKFNKEIYKKDKMEYYLNNYKNFIENREIEKEKKKVERTGLIGVRKKDGRSGGYEVYINVNNKRIYCGKSHDIQVAARIYDDYVIKMGLDRPLNFPSEKNEPKIYNKKSLIKSIYCVESKIKFKKVVDASKYMGITFSYFWVVKRDTGKVKGFTFLEQVDNPEEYVEWDGVKKYNGEDLI